MNNKTPKYEFKDKLITMDDNIIKVEMLSGYQSSFELIINNRELIPSIHKWIADNRSVYEFIKIKYVNENDLWYFNCDNKSYICSGEDLSLLNLDM